VLSLWVISKESLREDKQTFGEVEADYYEVFVRFVDRSLKLQIELRDQVISEGNFNEPFATLELLQDMENTMAFQ